MSSFLNCTLILSKDRLLENSEKLAEATVQLTAKALDSMAAAPGAKIRILNAETPTIPFIIVLTVSMTCARNATISTVTTRTDTLYNV
jgi:hypothetical protein